jgi:glycosyltransferase involved in cell wall biosynthesis
MEVHQFHPSVSYGDAIGNQILAVQRLLRRIGYRSEVFCYHAPLHFEGRARQIADFGPYSSAENVLLLHYSIGYPADVLAWLHQVPDRKVLVYHNITPHSYFAGINDTYLEASQAGRQQLRQLRTQTEAGWGVSTYNCRELAELGWDRLAVLPIVFEPGRYEARPDKKVLGRWRGGLNVLFVGRSSPNKCLEDIILAFYYVKECVRPDARLLLVGSASGMEPYLEFLQALVARLGLSDVRFAGHVSHSELIAYYQSASVYLSMSEHEGFGVPFLESMYFGVPIVAYKAAAVPETLATSAIQFTSKDHAAVAELIGLLAEDGDLRARIVARQHARLQDFLPERIEQQLQVLVRDL